MNILKIGFNKICLDKIDTCHKCLNLSFNYSINEEQNKISKSFSLERDNTIGFVRSIMNEVRKEVKEKHFPEDDNPFSAVTVLWDEREDGEMEEKTVKALERIKHEIKGFKSVKTSDNYFAAYQRVNSMVVDIK